jgi:hypothetical protein
MPRKKKVEEEVKVEEEAVESSRNETKANESSPTEVERVILNDMVVDFVPRTPPVLAQCVKHVVMHTHQGKFTLSLSSAIEKAYIQAVHYSNNALLFELVLNRNHNIAITPLSPTAFLAVCEFHNHMEPGNKVFSFINGERRAGEVVRIRPQGIYGVRYEDEEFGYYVDESGSLRILDVEIVF